MTDSSDQTFKYEYDSAGRLTKSGACTWTYVWPIWYWVWTDETTQAYDSGTGELTQATYKAGASTYDAAGRAVRIQIAPARPGAGARKGA